MIAQPRPDPIGDPSVSQVASSPSRHQLRLRSIAWALGAGLAALALGLPLGIESSLRAGLVGAVCGIHSLGLPSFASWPSQLSLTAAMVKVAPTVMIGIVRAWLPLVGAALLLHLLRHGSRLLMQRVLSAPGPTPMP